MISQEALRLPPEGRSVSQNSLDFNSMEDYWSEVKSMEENSHGCQEELLERSVDGTPIPSPQPSGKGGDSLFNLVHMYQRGLGEDQSLLQSVGQ